MIALTIVGIKEMMSQLLTHQMFDGFYLNQADIETFTGFHMDGDLNRDYFSSDEQEVLEGRTQCLWSEIKPIVFAIMKGRKLPVKFKLVFQLSEKNLLWLLEKNQLSFKAEEIGGLYMNILYEHKKLTCTSGVSFKTFVMDKTLEQVWDATVRQYFKQYHIEIE